MNELIDKLTEIIEELRAEVRHDGGYTRNLEVYREGELRGLEVARDLARNFEGVSHLRKEK